MEVLEVNGRSYPIEIVKAMKRTSSVRIRGGKVVLRLSRYLYGRERADTAEKLLGWAEDRLMRVSGDFVEPIYEDGREIVTHNKSYYLKIKFSPERARSFSKLQGDNVIEIKTSDLGRVKGLAEKIIMKDQANYLEEVLDEVNQLHFQEYFAGCRFKRMNSRFGSCSSKRNINIAFKLLFAPREVFRYVCVHELAHLKEFNHSKRFWILVEGAMPDYKVQEKWLKENGLLLG